MVRKQSNEKSNETVSVKVAELSPGRRENSSLVSSSASKAFDSSESTAFTTCSIPSSRNIDIESPGSRVIEKLVLLPFLRLTRAGFTTLSPFAVNVILKSVSRLPLTKQLTAELISVVPKRCGTE